MTADAIVIGSGFGGSIAALRLAEAGNQVVVLERGRRWQPADFPRTPRDVDRVFWHLGPRDRSRGLFDMRLLSGIGVVCGAGVGGGSLVYANVHIRPDADVFDDWPEPYSLGMLKPYYDKVAAMLHLAPVPERHKLPKRDWFHGLAEQLGFACFDPDHAVNWDASPGRPACDLRARCEFGCTAGAKNSLDVTYLRAAEALGVSITTDVLVTQIAPAQGGGYTVMAENVVTREQTSFTAPRVIVAAGTLGTNEILLRSRTLGTLPLLSDALGSRFSGNGDFIGTLQNVRERIEGWRGPDVTSVMRCEQDGCRFTLAAPTFNQPTADILAALGLPRTLPPAADAWQGLGDLLRTTFERGAFDQPLPVPLPGAGDPAQMTNLFAIGRDNAGGRVTFAADTIDIAWRYADDNAALVAAMDKVMQRIAELAGGRYAPLPTWTVFRRPMSVHPLGGCRIAESRDDGVVDPFGRVHGYPGLYVADGSVIPASIGFHPAMTIAALCEHIAAGLQRETP